MTTNGVTSRLLSKNEDWNERFKDRLPHVFVGIVAFQDICHEIYNSHMVWALGQGSRLAGRVHISFGMACRKEQYRARNHLVNHATDEGADFMLMIDDDQTLHNTPQLIERFYEVGESVAGAMYYQRGGAYHPVVMKEFIAAGGKTSYRFFTTDEIPTEPQAVDVLGGGCTWTDMSVFDKLKEPHWWPYPEKNCFVPDPEYGLDVNFCRKARNLGYQCVLVPDLVVGHLAHTRKVIDAESRPSEQEIYESAAYKNYLVAVKANQQSSDFPGRT